MPGGPLPLGFAYFVGVKFVGYTAAAAVIRRLYPESKATIAKVGLTRTLIGIAAGAAYGGLWYVAYKFLPPAGKEQWDLYYLVGLFPVRIAEWMWLIYLFFNRTLLNRPRAVGIAVGGTVWSYCLDAICIAAAFVIPGGAWIC
jgi:hypothetical protein